MQGIVFLEGRDTISRFQHSLTKQRWWAWDLDWEPAGSPALAQLQPSLALPNFPGQEDEEGTSVTPDCKLYVHMQMYLWGKSGLFSDDHASLSAEVITCTTTCVFAAALFSVEAITRFCRLVNKGPRADVRLAFNLNGFYHLCR